MSVIEISAVSGSHATHDDVVGGKQRGNAFVDRLKCNLGLWIAHHAIPIVFRLLKPSVEVCQDPVCRMFLVNNKHGTLRGKSQLRPFEAGVEPQNLDELEGFSLIWSNHKLPSGQKVDVGIHWSVVAQTTNGIKAP